MFVCDTIASCVNDNLKQTCNSIQTASPPCGLYLAACFLNMYIGGLFSNCITFQIQTSTSAMMWTNPSRSITYVYIRSWWEDGLFKHYSEPPLQYFVDQVYMNACILTSWSIMGPNANTGPIQSTIDTTGETGQTVFSLHCLGHKLPSQLKSGLPRRPHTAQIRPHSHSDSLMW